MAKKKKAPELTFQQHVAGYLVLEHKYGVLEQSDDFIFWDIGSYSNHKFIEYMLQIWQFFWDFAY